MSSPDIGIPSIKVRWSWDRFIFIIANPTLVRRHFYPSALRPKGYCRCLHPSVSLSVHFYYQDCQCDNLGNFQIFLKLGWNILRSWVCQLIEYVHNWIVISKVLSCSLELRFKTHFLRDGSTHLHLLWEEGWVGLGTLAYIDVGGGTHFQCIYKWYLVPNTDLGGWGCLFGV